ncbi:MAG: CRISPR-associated endonuclease Cas2 [Acidobacteria bacterium]|nr:CRISPR-associated endonuclease Cas2 [Acidobacteriota bacterium]
MFVVAYDISDDRRRTRLFNTLKRYGTPVQESVFECHLTVNQFLHMRQAVERLIKPQEDQVRFYELCQKCADRILATAASVRTADPVAIVA